MRDVFVAMNHSKSGRVSLRELLQWTSRFQSSCALSCYHFLFMELVQPVEQHQLSFIELVATMADFCPLSQDGLLAFVFDGLATSETSSGVPAIDITHVRCVTSSPCCFHPHRVLVRRPQLGSPLPPASWIRVWVCRS